MKQAEFDLMSNPFAVLRIGVRSTRADAASARDEVIWDHDIDETMAQQAYAALATPKERLASEVGFLLGMTPAAARKTLDALRRGEVSLPGDDVPPLAAANLLAHGLSHGGDPDEWAPALVEAYKDIDAGSVTEEIVANYQISGERPPTARDVDAVLLKLSERHGEILAQALATPPKAELAEQIVEYWPQGDMPSRLGNAFIAAYRRRIAKPLTAHEERIDSLEKALLEEPSIEYARELAGALADWDHLRQPIQIWDAAHGLDEPDSERLGERLRILSVRLVNEKRAFAEARVIVDALVLAFPELPALGKKLRKVSEELDEAAADAVANEAMGPLLTAVEAILKDQGVADRHLGRSVANSDWPKAGALRAAFAAAISHDPTLAVRIVRSLAIRLHNEHNRSVAALGLTKWLQQVAPKETDPEAVQQLAADMKTLGETLGMAEIKSAAERGDHAAVAEVAKRLASGSDDPDERRSLLLIAAQAEERKRKEDSARATRWIFGAVAVLGVLFVVLSDEKRPNYGEAPAADYLVQYDSPPPEDEPPAADAMAPASEATDAIAPAANAADSIEQSLNLPAAGVPNIYRGSKYSAEYRACAALKSSIRAEEYSIDNTDQFAVDAFNNKIDRFNRECAGQWRSR